MGRGVASSLGSRQPAPKLLRCELAEVCQLALLSLAALGHVLLRTCRHVHSTRLCPRPPTRNAQYLRGRHVGQRRKRLRCCKRTRGRSCGRGGAAGCVTRRGRVRDGRGVGWQRGRARTERRSRTQGAREGDARHGGKGMRSGGAWAGVGGCGLVRRVRHDVIVRDIDARAVLSRS